jgi:hypothetical protein
MANYTYAVFKNDDNTDRQDSATTASIEKIVMNGNNKIGNSSLC